MRFGFYTCLFGLGAMAGPGQANEISGQLYIKNVVAQQAQAPLGVNCPDGMVYRTIHIETAITELSIAAAFMQLPKKAIVIRRAGKRADGVAQPARRTPAEQPTNWVGAQPKEVDVVFNVDLRVCEAMGFVELADGRLTVTGTVGFYRLAFDRSLHGGPQDDISIDWQRRATDRKVGDVMGQLGLWIEGVPIKMMHEDGTSEIKAQLKMEVRAEVLDGGVGR
tara:strand:- start:15863 stop:16528 length:666 start_codon:yes stop_codon:yes gene_type:complete